MATADPLRGAARRVRQLAAARLPLQRRTLRGKLTAVILLTAALTLLVAGVLLLSHDLRVQRQAWADALAAQAELVALSTAPALAADDRARVQRELAALEMHPEVSHAAVYDRAGARYAYHVRAGAQPPPRVPPSAAGTSLAGGRTTFSRPIGRGAERLGTLYLRAEHDPIGPLLGFLGDFALIMAMSMSAALVLSPILSRALTGPLDAMADVARNIVERRDYTLRAEHPAQDEMGVVVKAFNSMLDEVQARTRALERANAALEDEVRTRLQAEAELARANARLESSMAAAEVGSCVWDLHTDEVLGDRNFGALYGLPDAGEVRTDGQTLRRFIHGDDLPAVLAAEQVARASGVLTSPAFRVVRPDGAVHWLAARGKLQFDAAGRPLRLAALLIDITAQKEAEQALRASEKLYRAIGESLDFGVWVTDAEGNNVYTSESFLRLTGMQQAGFSRSGWLAVLHPDDAPATLAGWRECIRAGQAWYREFRVRDAGGAYHAVLSQGVPIAGDNGRITGWAGINLDISRLKRSELALREADRRKDEFLATLAHELRNPLAPIRHAVALLEARGSDAEQQALGREVIARQVRRMALLLDDLLDVSRITRGRLKLKTSPTVLDVLVDTAIETARPLLEAKGHAFAVERPDGPLVLDVDPLRLSQALSNLLVNAAKYTDAGGRITLTVRLSGSELLFAVGDSGVGLSAAAMPHLFAMFSQIDGAGDRAEGGLGIGLALVKGLVELHGGTVRATSAGPGRGSEFTIALPRALVSHGTRVVHAPAPMAPPLAGPGGRIVVADDNRDAADMLARILRCSGHTVTVAHHGPEALEASLRECPDALVLDIGMPGMSGYEVARRIRRQAWGRDALLLAVTGWGQEDDRERARRAGFDHHLTKPVAPERVERLIEAHLHRPRTGAAPTAATRSSEVARETRA